MDREPKLLVDEWARAEPCVTLQYFSSRDWIRPPTAKGLIDESRTKFERDDDVGTGLSFSTSKLFNCL